MLRSIDLISDFSCIHGQRCVYGWTLSLGVSVLNSSYTYNRISCRCVWTRDRVYGGHRRSCLLTWVLKSIWSGYGVSLLLYTFRFSLLRRKCWTGTTLCLLFHRRLPLRPFVCWSITGEDFCRIRSPLLKDHGKRTEKTSKTWNY